MSPSSFTDEIETSRGRAVWGIDEKPVDSDEEDEPEDIDDGGGDIGDTGWDNKGLERRDPRFTLVDWVLCCDLDDGDDGDSGKDGYIGIAGDWDSDVNLIVADAVVKPWCGEEEGDEVELCDTFTWLILKLLGFWPCKYDKLWDDQK